MGPSAALLIDAPPGHDYPSLLAQWIGFADVAQLAEHPICNRAVASSILAVGSLSSEGGRRHGRSWVGYPSGQREQTVNLPAYAFEGSNPSPTMMQMGDGRCEK